MQYYPKFQIAEKINAKLQKMGFGGDDVGGEMSRFRVKLVVEMFRFRVNLTFEMFRFRAFWVVKVL